MKLWNKFIDLLVMIVYVTKFLYKLNLFVYSKKGQCRNSLKLKELVRHYRELESQADISIVEFK